MLETALRTLIGWWWFRYRYFGDTGQSIYIYRVVLGTDMGTLRRWYRFFSLDAWHKIYIYRYIDRSTTRIRYSMHTHLYVDHMMPMCTWYVVGRTRRIMMGGWRHAGRASIPDNASRRSRENRAMAAESWHWRETTIGLHKTNFDIREQTVIKASAKRRNVILHTKMMIYINDIDLIRWWSRDESSLEYSIRI